MLASGLLGRRRWIPAHAGARGGVPREGVRFERPIVNSNTSWEARQAAVSDRETYPERPDKAAP